MTSQRIDHLCPSPSLLSILQLLNRNDISSCALVNRRLCHLINSNTYIFPRKFKTAEINLNTKLSEDSSQVGYVCAHVTICQREECMRVYTIVTNHRLRVRHPKGQRDRFIEYFQQHFEHLGDTTGLPDQEFLKQIKLLGDEEGPYGTVDFKIDNIKSVLAKLFYLIAKHFKIGKIRIDLKDEDDPFEYQTPAEIIGMLGDIVAQCVPRPSTDFFVVMRNFEGIDQFCNNIGCKWVEVRDFEGSIGEYLNNITKWNKNIGMIVDYKACLEGIVELMEKWQGSDAHISHCVYVAVDTFNDTTVEFSWSPVEMATLLFYRLRYIRAEYNHYLKENGSTRQNVEIVVTRDTDDSVLHLSYGQTELYLSEKFSFF